MDTSPPPVLHQVTTVNNFQNAQEGIWPHGPVHLTRGRQAKDPNAKTITFNVASLDEFESSLRNYLDNPPEQPEHSECQLSFWIGASFTITPNQQRQPSQQHQQQQQPVQHQQPLHQPPPVQSHPQAPPGYQPANGHPPQYGASATASNAFQTTRQHVSISDPAVALTLSAFHTGAPNGNDNSDGSTAMSILEALVPTPDPKDRMKKQRAIAKCCVDAIQRTDGYRYSFHNCWNSREDDSFRFSYYCNDSLLNKDRAANGKGAKYGKRATKPVYDCKGVLSVKFSATKQSLDIFYKHVPVHKTYEERAPPPRKDSKRRKFLEEHDPEALTRIVSKPKPLKLPEQSTQDPNAPPKPKRKRTKRDDPQKQTAANSIESDLRAQSLRSLLELIQVDPAPEPAPEQPPKPIEEPSVSHSQQVIRRRPRNSCDICKAKKTKCDGARPVCSTCAERQRQCLYTEPPPIERPRPTVSVPPQVVHQSEPERPPPVENHQESELEKLRKQLEAATSEIAKLKAEKTQPPPENTIAPQQTQAPQQTRPPHRTPQVPQRTTQTPQRAQVPPAQPPQHQIPAPPSQPPQHQIQTPQYSPFPVHSSQSVYGVNRSIHSPNPPQPTPSPMSQIQAPNSGIVPSSNQSHAAPSTLNHQMQAAASGLAATPDTGDAYGRDFGRWSTTNYYQNFTQGQQDQWGTGNNSRLYR